MQRLGRFLFRIRSGTPVPLIILMLWFARPTAFSIALGALLTLLGELGRLWAVGYAGASTRTRTLGAARHLVTTGPYAHVRNPLYLSNGLISAGVCVASGVYWMLPLLLLGYLIQYVPIVRSEEGYLENTYGTVYATYRGQVPRWMPRWRGYAQASQHDFSWIRALRSERRTLSAILIVWLLALSRPRWPIP